MLTESTTKTMAAQQQLSSPPAAPPGGNNGGSARLALRRDAGEEGAGTSTTTPAGGAAARDSSSAAEAHEEASPPPAAAEGVTNGQWPDSPAAEEQQQMFTSRPRPPLQGAGGPGGDGEAATGGCHHHHYRDGRLHAPPEDGPGHEQQQQQGVCGPFALPQRQKSFWEGQGSVAVAPEEERGGGDSSDTLGAESDTEEERKREEEMAAALAAAVAEGGASSPSPCPSASGGSTTGGFPLADEPSSSSLTAAAVAVVSPALVLPTCASSAAGPVAGAAVGSAAASTTAAAAGSSSSGGNGAGGAAVAAAAAAAAAMAASVMAPGGTPAGPAGGAAGGLVVETPAPVGGGGVGLGMMGLAHLGPGLHHGRGLTSMPSILPQPEALLAIRERSYMVPLPVAVSRTFGERNNSMIDRRAWLEVEDRKHRYAKNLRLYFKEWDRRGQPGSSFWAWLDQGDGGEGDSGLVELEECPRSQLETETVHYCSSPEERRAYEIRFFGGGRLHRRREARGEEWQAVTTGAEGWIFVLREGIVYAHEKKTDQVPRFHHSSFFAGECVQAAGLLVARDGVLERLYPHSGHYRPTDSHLLSLLLFLEQQGVDLESVQVDVQLVMRVARGHDADRGRRRKKIDSPYMWTGGHAKHFLLAKRQAWAGKLFAQVIMHPLTLAEDS